MSIDATVTSDGTLQVVETRTFDFDGSFNGVYWRIPTGHNESNGQDVEVTLLYAGEGDPDSLTPFEESDSGLDGTYELSGQGGDVVQVKLFAPHEDQAVSFTIAYEATGIVTRWQDTGELYWKFVSDGWDVESQDVTCVLHLPVPAGEFVTPGDNVRAWGHGPLDSAVSFDGNDVRFVVPGVGTDEFAEMRVTFPTSWVAGLEETPAPRLDAILSEERQWADEANAARARARVLYFGAIVVAAAFAVGAVVYALVCRARYRHDFTPRFSDAYFRDVPTADHPAVLGALANGGSVESKELTATLMRLTDEGYVRLDKVTSRHKGLLGEKTEEDYRLTKLRDVPDPSDEAGPVVRTGLKIDQAALRLLFGRAAGKRDEEGASLCFSELEDYAKRHPQAYSDAYDVWKGAVEGACLERFAGSGERVRGKLLIQVLCGADVVVLGAGALILAIAEAPIYVIVILAGMLLAVCALLAWVASSMKDLNREAVEVRAQLDALRRWLREFTRLEEAVPEDVVLWNRLLVMAVVLGVADEVVEQLKVALPQMLEDPCLMPTYGWFYWYGMGSRRPVDAFSERVDSAHHVSAAALAGTSASSVGGGGGGFSGGGGGGFGGGGGGGAF
ncbi:DUF2207 domain-containing protein [Olsenella profusa]|uniref:DUF2207 domain-containing protein n=1 Tax=Olsenella profusa TaxID=138595 RepID=A0ABS2EZW5_9ACTN|nr:DUF2207 domain-containing protein [Olsenella profusa]